MEWEEVWVEEWEEAWVVVWGEAWVEEAEVVDTGEDGEFRYIYGPVPSRRLGRSLGVSPIPFKTCNYSCIYCQLGKTSNLTNERKEYFPLSGILEEFEEMVKRIGGNFDTVTIVGEGEPLLYSRIGDLVEGIKRIIGTRLAVITNGSLLYRSDLQEELSNVDVVLPSLDAWDERSFRFINRPVRDLSFNVVLEGMVSFRGRFKNQIWLEVMLMDGVNDTPENLRKLRSSIDRIKPDEVFINVPIRPPAEPWVRIPKDEKISLAERILSGKSMAYIPEGEFHAGSKDVVKSVISLIKRHPMRECELKKYLMDRLKNEDDVEEVFQTILSDPKLEMVEGEKGRFLRMRTK